MKDKVSYIDELINVKNCFDGICETKDGRYLTAIEILPINFNFKTGSEQEKIISDFEKYLRISPISIQIKTVSKRTNVNNVIQNADDNFNAVYTMQTLTGSIVEIHEDELDLIYRLGNRQGVARHFYIVLEYIQSNTYIAKDVEDIVFYLNKAKDTARQYLYACGNVVITHKDEELFMLELCHSILNKTKSKSELYKKLNDMVDKANAYYDYDEEKVENLETPYDNLISPDEIRLFSDYCVVDGTYYTFLLIHSDAYPTYVEPAWMSGLINYGEGIDLDLFIRRENTTKVRNDLRRRSRLNRTRQRHMDVHGANYEEMEKSLYASEYIKDKLATGDALYYINTMITISADSYDNMYMKYSAVKEMLDSIDVSVMGCKYFVEKALAAYMPLNQLDKSLFEKTKRNITTSDLAGFFPFTSYEISDDNGILLGVNKDNNSLVVLDIFNTQKYKNANIAILGTSGSGKTFTLGITLKRMAMQGIKTFLIAPLKGQEYYRLCKSIGGQVIKISSGSPNCINIMEIRPENSDTKIELGLISEDEEEIILNKKVTTLRTFFSLVIRDMSYTEKELLDRAILETYERFGITKDNNSLIDHYEEEQKDGRTIRKAVYKKMPILKDLYDTLKDDPKTERMSDILYSYVEGSASSFNGQTNVNLDSPFTVLDISSLTNELIPIGMFLALDYVWDKAKEDVMQRKVIAVDETWMLIRNSELAADFVLEIFKIIRGYGGSAIAASQDISDFFALNKGEYGKAIISNSKTKIVLNLETDEAETVQNILNLSNRERKQIESFERGNMLVVSNNNTFTLAFTASDIETKLITTDGKMLKELAKDHRFKNGIFVGENQNQNND